MQSHLVQTKFLSVSFLESLRVPCITSTSLEGAERLHRGRRGKGLRKNDKEKEGRRAGRKTHLDEELQLPVIQEMDLTAPPLCHLKRDKKHKRSFVKTDFSVNKSNKTHGRGHICAAATL